LFLIEACPRADNRVAVSTLPTLADHIDDELMRAPLVAEQMVEGTLDALARAATLASSYERTTFGEITQALRQQRSRLGLAYAQSLREQAERFQQRAHRQRQPSGSSTQRGELELSLVDETAVSADIEITRLAEAIKLQCEAELRELGAFVAALVGDMEVAADHNPLGAEAHARALWAGSGAIGVSAGHRAVFMRHASGPMAEVLRKAFASACRRLEDAGVEPGMHRTLIVAGGGRAGAGPGPRTISDQALRAIAEQMAGPGEPNDRQRLDLLGRLFDYVTADRRLGRAAAATIARLQPIALRLARRDPALVEHDQHPLWQFIDAIAAQSDTVPEPPHPDGQRMFETLDALVDDLVARPDPDAQLMRWALDRLAAAERGRLKRRVQAEGQRIARLEIADARAAAVLPPAPEGGIVGATQPLDIGALDTVPAELLDEPCPAGDAAAWVDALLPGDRLRIFLGGSRVPAQLLWRGPGDQVFLLTTGRGETLAALDRGALLRLRSEGLAEALPARSLVREALDIINARIAIARGS
jgi:hypothetical protein